MKKATTIRKLITLSLCLMMCLSVFAPASVFAKCSHKNTKLVVLKEVTCTRNGKCVKVCIKCGKNLKTCSVKKLGHTYKHIYIKPTCNNRGWEGTMCKRCGYSVAEKSYPALGHNYKTTVYKGTCNTPGVTVKVCKRCGDRKSYSTGKALGHKWGKWQLVSINGGKARYSRTCSRCHKTKYKNN